jgi:hypothetical protein
VEKDFSPEDRVSVENQSVALLNAEFNKEGLTVCDVNFNERPHQVNDVLKSF